MFNLSLNELQIIPKSRSIKGYKIMSADRLLGVLNLSESVKKVKKKKKGLQNQQETKITMLKH